MIRIYANRYYWLVSEIIGERGIIFLLKYTLAIYVDMVMRILYQVYSYAYSILFKAPLIYVIGDSHSWAFKNQRSFIIRNIGPATAYNLVNRNSTIQSYRKLLKAVEKIDRKKDYVILTFGEIDCRVHFYNQYMKNNGKVSMDKLMDTTIENYGQVLSELRARGVNFLVYGVLPAARDVVRYPPYATKKIREEVVNSFKSNYHYQASPEMRSYINRRFNQKLKAYCLAHQYKYLDIYPVVADKQGFVRDEFVADEIHVNGRIMPYVKEMLKKECNLLT
ncbi:SGNH/GDSL hydrolase family protein [Methanocella sp. MCL-LM]|uniref:SGNH/GDSL hydrolase family protein n=1 Tax=Methanocella sp. MCL-LM TaxID=3412035 RepID=UPI003C7932A5